ncbi:CRISPR-associated exonuclease, Cas4 family [Thermosyntropha lipolytica DSM 11003]|uniref:CRISPR-associated exonuclease Cas4 n=1 Tax=Thermosyntropha lipolytica DSM 11003 TaxID=1123382 RepID=A0A1M5Q3W3_9FIRM|nr:CRISPR-associated protein Cas4 [Thermosyntropha lipolytica]SHH08540.1 CRISPR-associated exonuclease, Cas4 family [Thermosyntropha lipolytica DSM 11003]
MKDKNSPEVQELAITGTMVSYFFICHRKLWLFAKGINMENVSGNADVIKGKILHEARFKHERNREITFDTVKIDFLRFNDQVYVHEIKKSKKFEEAHIWQLKYYIYYLQCQGVNCFSGVIHYPASMRKVNVEFDANDRIQLMQVLKGIQEILKKPILPPKKTKKFCSRCAYFDFCYA